MNDPVRHEVESTTATVDQMAHRFLKVHEMDKVKVAAAIAKSSYRTLIFCRTKRGCDRLTDQLKREDIKAGALHGDLAQSVRQRALKQFEDGTLPVLVATDVAARGLHIEGVDVVIHYDPPEDEKAYLHRSGRTARAGASGVAVSLALWNQELEVERLQKRLQLPRHFVEIFSNDPRLSRPRGLGARGAGAARQRRRRGGPGSDPSGPGPARGRRQPRRARPSMTTESIEIVAPAEVVWALVSDLTRMPEWSPETTKVEWTGGSTGPSVGATFKGSNRMGPRRWSTSCRSSPPTRPMSWRGTSPPSAA